MPRSSLEAFTALWRAYGEGRLERSLDLVDPDCVITFTDGTTTLRGHDGIRGWLADARGAWKTLTVTYSAVLEPGPDCLIGLGRLRASAFEGAELDWQIAFVAEFDTGRLVRGRMFRDREAALQHVAER